MEAKILQIDEWLLHSFIINAVNEKNKYVIQTVTRNYNSRDQTQSNI